MGQNPAICAANQRTASDYTSRFYMASAKAGETLRMRWTPNGHQRGAGQNPLTYAIHWTGVPGTQLTNRLQLNDTNKLAGPFPFDATCYCNNCAGDPCYGSFTIPANTKSGVYSFIWYWVFNRDASSGGEEYTTCFDVAVTGNNVAPPPTTATPKTSARTSAPRTTARTSADAKNTMIINSDEETDDKETINVTPTIIINNKNSSDVDNINGGNGSFGNLAVTLVLFMLSAVWLF
jgi:hypothetical protein